MKRHSIIPPLRGTLETFPSPLADQPGLIIRDPHRFSDATLVVPPRLTPALAYLDGEHSLADLEHLARPHLGASASARIEDLVVALRQAGFLESREFEVMRKERIDAFAEARVRAAVHAGGGYPAEPDRLEETLRNYGAGPAASTANGELLGLIAPHVSPFGGASTYAAAYARLGPEHRDKTFIVLGTSHYGPPEQFGLTVKPFATPFGEAQTDVGLVHALHAHARPATTLEDYCHAIEHSIEFQVIFLQHAIGRANVRIVPILCGPFFDSLEHGRRPESHDGVRAFIDALIEVQQKRSDLVFVLGVDLAHIGLRYGDDVALQSSDDAMRDIEARDRDRLERIYDNDPDGFFELVHPDGDDLRWCGYAPLYTFLRACPGARFRELSYDSWNIDDGSVVSFVATEILRS